MTLSAFHIRMQMALAACVISPVCLAQTYSVVDLGMPPDGDAAYAWDINDAGVVFGTVHLDGHRRSACFIHHDRELTLLPAEFDMPFIWSGAINNVNALIGATLNPFPVVHREPFVTGVEFIPDLFPLFPASALCGATDVNNGQPPWAVGQLITPHTIGFGDLPVYHAYMVLVDGNPNPPVDIGTLGGPYSRAEALNDARDIVGGSLTGPGPMRAFLRRNSTGVMVSLGTLGGSASQARDINNSQQVVGWARTRDGGTQAFLYDNFAMTALGTLGGQYSEADGINDAGLIVGMSFDVDGRPRAFLHRDGVMIDLNQRIDGGSGWRLQHAQAINNAGQIVGWGRRGGQTRAFLLTPALTPADLNGDGVVNTLDLGILLASWTVPPRTAACDGAASCPADLNNDGVVNTLDLGILLASWTL